MIPVEYEQFEQIVTVGVTNFTPVWGDTKETLNKIEANIVEAVVAGHQHRRLRRRGAHRPRRVRRLPVRRRTRASSTRAWHRPCRAPPPTTSSSSRATTTCTCCSGSPSATRTIPRCSTTRSRWSDPKACSARTTRCTSARCRGSPKGSCSRPATPSRSSRPATGRSACRSVTTSGSTPSSRGSSR